MEQPRLAIVIPAFCEERTIGAIVAAAGQHGEVIVVDDCSNDATADRARNNGAVVVTNLRNAGYDATLSRGFEEADRRGFTHVVTIDADGEHDPATLAQFRSLLFSGTQLVLGVRPAKQRFAEIVMGWYVRARFGARDILCGMKGYDLALWRRNGGFDHHEGIGTELAINSMRAGVPFREVSVAGTARVDAPRFDRRFRANIRILKALGRVLRHDGRRAAV